MVIIVPFLYLIFFALFVAIADALFPILSVTVLYHLL